MTQVQQATLIFIKRSNSVLLGFKCTGEIGKGKFNAPGGKQEEEESLVACIIRETHEEIGVVVLPRSLAHRAILYCYANNELFQIVHVYIAEEYLGKPGPTHYMNPVKWFDADALPFDKMHAADRKWVPMLLKGERFSADIRYQKPGEGFLNIKYHPYTKEAAH